MLQKVEPALGCTSKEWRHVYHLTPDDFIELVRNQDWKFLEWIYSKAKSIEAGCEIPEPLEEFIALYDLACEQMQANPTEVPRWIVNLIRRE